MDETNNENKFNENELSAEDEICRQCCHFMEDEDSVVADLASKGECWRHPPVINTVAEFVHPKVKGTHWCGEWKTCRIIDN